jgi:hypothetical protein
VTEPVLYPTITRAPFGGAHKNQEPTERIFFSAGVAWDFGFSWVLYFAFGASRELGADITPMRISPATAPAHKNDIGP